MITLKGGHKTIDRRLDRIPFLDPRSRSYPIHRLVANKTPRSYTWRCDSWFDQGQEGACVGFSWAHELAARPKVIVSSEAQARQIYLEAQKIDEWPGEAYEGTSVLAGAKIVQQLGYMKEYRWCFGLQDLILAVGYSGPVIVGINWYTGMAWTDSEGYVRPTGSIAGGHAIMVNGVSVTKERFKLRNSWGKSFGINGDCYISFKDMERLLKEDGEAVVPVVRKLLTSQPQ